MEYGDPSWEFGFGEVLLSGTDRKYGAWNDIKKRYLGLKGQWIKKEPSEKAFKTGEKMKTIESLCPKSWEQTL